MNNIAAVVVTYNRLTLLKECIASLKGQSHGLSSIIVVNNGSTDGTLEWLEAQNDILLITQENLGGAAGFYRGIKDAYAKGYDWVWVMDDDAFPQEDCLEKLLLASQSVKGDKVVLAPVIVEGNKIDSLHRGFINFKKVQYPLQDPVDEANFNSNENPLEISFASFIGMFISKKVIENSGYPRPDYFIFHDDVEYSIRITKAENSIYLVKDAVIYHKVKSELAIKNYTSDQKKEPKNNTFSEKLRYRKNKYAELNKGTLFKFIGKRNWIRTSIIHNGFSFGLLVYLIKDYSANLSYVFLSKSHKLKLFKVFNQVYYQGLTGKFNNKKILI